MRDGEVLSPQDFKALAEEDRGARAEAIERLQKEMEEILREIPCWEKEQREQLKSLNHEVTRFAVGHLVDELKAKWSDHPAVLTHLEAVHADVVENADDCTNGAPLAEMMRRASKGPDVFRRYQVNLLVDHMLADGDSENAEHCQRRSDSRPAQHQYGAASVAEFSTATYNNVRLGATLSGLWFLQFRRQQVSFWRSIAGKWC